MGQELLLQEGFCRKRGRGRFFNGDSNFLRKVESGEFQSQILIDPVNCYLHVHDLVGFGYVEKMLGFLRYFEWKEVVLFFINLCRESLLGFVGDEGGEGISGTGGEAGKDEDKCKSQSKTHNRI